MENKLFTLEFCTGQSDSLPQLTTVQNSAVHFLECVFGITENIQNHSLTPAGVKGQLTVCRRTGRRQIHGFRECGCGGTSIGQLKPAPQLIKKAINHSPISGNVNVTNFSASLENSSKVFGRCSVRKIVNLKRTQTLEWRQIKFSTSIGDICFRVKKTGIFWKIVAEKMCFLL